MEKYKIRIIRTVKGFGDENVKSLLVCGEEYGTEENFIEQLNEVLGVSSWDGVPEQFRRNGRNHHGALHGNFCFSDLRDDADYAAILACVDAARMRSSKEVTVVERVI